MQERNSPVKTAIKGKPFRTDSRIVRNIGRFVFRFSSEYQRLLTQTLYSFAAKVSKKQEIKNHAGSVAFLIDKKAATGA